MLAERGPRRRSTLHGQSKKKLRCAGLVARAACPEPDPISNSAVKHASAHGTVSQGTGESVAARPAQRNHTQHPLDTISATAPEPARHRRTAKPDQPHNLGAGWSSPVARQAHNLKVTGSNPVPATKLTDPEPGPLTRTGFLRSGPPRGTGLFRGREGRCCGAGEGADRQPHRFLCQSNVITILPNGPRSR